ncbi:MAG: GNAT family N-acetyltransferase [Sciscionella sp.]
MPTIIAEPIDTRRLDLVPLAENHADALVDVLSDPALHTFIGGQPDTLDELRARYRRVLAGAPEPGVHWCNWVAYWHGDDQPIGTLQASITERPDGLLAEIAGVVGTAWQSNGVAREMAQALIKWMKGHRVRRVTAHIHPDHGASSAVVIAAGLRPTLLRVNGEVEWELWLDADDPARQES